MRVFDASTYTQYGDSNNIFVPSAFGSAPIVLSDGGVIAADAKRVGYRPPGNNTTWITTRKKTTDTTPVNDDGTPVSPVLVGSKIVFIAEKCPIGSSPTTAPDCGISTYKVVQSGTTVTSLDLKAFKRLKVGSNYYETLNTPTVDLVHNRVYIAASIICPACGLNQDRDAKIFSADIDPASGGISNLTAIYSFTGPGGASPVLVVGEQIGGVTGNGIYFDGQTHYVPPATPDCSASVATASDYAGCFYKIFDTTAGTTPTVIASAVWVHSYRGSTFQAGGALDPRGGLWVYPFFQAGSGDPPTCVYGALDHGNCLIRLDQTTGNVVSGSETDLTMLINGFTTTPTQRKYAFMPSSALTLTRNLSTSSYYLTMGAMKASAGNYGTVPSVVTVNVTSTPALYSTTQTTVIGADTPSLPSPANGQFPVVTIGTHQKTVFTGQSFGPYFFGN
ncbi:hypothetical protein [Hydrocarboniphaga sp.]|uniref:hypothetical protein n=1 Tax=Hydrocarboniphaga sp. TaxID=2033016 RepID=UPI003D0C78F2